MTDDTTTHPDSDVIRRRLQQAANASAAATTPAAREPTTNILANKPQSKSDAPKTPKLATRAPGKKGGNQSGAAAPKRKFSLAPGRSQWMGSVVAPEQFSPARRDRLTRAIVAMSTRPDVLHELQVDTVDALAAVVAGAKVVGPAGHGDRMTLFKLVGLPLHAGSAMGSARADATAAIAHLGRRLEQALTGRSGPARHDPVTVDAEVIEEGPSNGHDRGHTQKMGQLVRMPTPADPGAPDDGQVGEAAPEDTPPNIPPPTSLPAFLRRK